jgi:thiosulfate/3-mercaptopyruvate sulfurtransferase
LKRGASRAPASAILCPTSPIQKNASRLRARPRLDLLLQLARSVSQTGSIFAVYDNSTGIWAARLWWLFKAFGHDAVSVLDGGLTAWLAESRPLERGPSVSQRTDFVASERPGFFVDQDEVHAIVEGRARGRLVCVLRPQVFAGTERKYSRPGHIPSSINLPYIELLGPDNRLLPESALTNALAPLIAGDERIIL